MKATHPKNEPKEWHEKCLKNVRATAEVQRNVLLNAAMDYARLVNSVAEYEAWIAKNYPKVSD